MIRPWTVSKPTAVACNCLLAIFSTTDTGAGSFGTPRTFRCLGVENETVTLEALCDGFNNCTNGQDEINPLCTSKLYIMTCLPKHGSTSLRIFLTEDNIYCINAYCINTCTWICTCTYVTKHYNSSALHFADKCRLPYNGGCDLTRECFDNAFSHNCGGCLPGFTPDLSGDPDNGPCIRK